jgi:drug/metabolite transporter (DMT)-like permease
MSQLSRGYLFGFLGVAIFSLTLPFTRIAVQYFDPLFVSIGRTVVAAAAAAIALVATRQPWPSRGDLKQLVIIAAGVVFGFPIFSALAMQSAPASHGGVVLGALPLATAVMSTVFAGERPSNAFWFWSVAGSLAVILFAVRGGSAGLQSADLCLFAALVLASMGYAASGNLARTLGGWQVICWALLLALPITLPLTVYFLPNDVSIIPASALGSFLYLSLMSQFLGFFAWNKGLATGGVARVGQIQLLQSFMTLAVSTLINNETITAATIGFALVVAACVWFGRKARVMSASK